MKTFDKIICTVRTRAEYQGQSKKPETEKIEGETHEFEVLWKMDYDDPYPGEWAMAPTDRTVKMRYCELGFAWLASGDLSIPANK